MVAATNQFGKTPRSNPRRFFVLCGSLHRAKAVGELRLELSKLAHVEIQLFPILTGFGKSNRFCRLIGPANPAVPFLPVFKGDVFSAH